MSGGMKELLEAVRKINQQRTPVPITIPSR